MLRRFRAPMLVLVLSVVPQSEGIAKRGPHFLGAELTLMSASDDSFLPMGSLRVEWLDDSEGDVEVMFYVIDSDADGAIDPFSIIAPSEGE